MIEFRITISLNDLTEIQRAIARGMGSLKINGSSYTLVEDENLLIESRFVKFYWEVSKSPNAMANFMTIYEEEKEKILGFVPEKKQAKLELNEPEPVPVAPAYFETPKEFLRFEQPETSPFIEPAPEYKPERKKRSKPEKKEPDIVLPHTTGRYTIVDRNEDKGYRRKNENIRHIQVRFTYTDILLHTVEYNFAENSELMNFNKQNAIKMALRWIDKFEKRF